MRSLQRSALALAASAAVLALVGCGSAGGGAADPDPDPTTPGEEQTVPMTEDQLLGKWSSEEPGNPRLEFVTAGEVRGSDGCNGIFSTYAIDGDRATIKPFASTMRACQGVDDWLRGVRSVAIDGDTLRAYDDAGTELGQLQREGAE